MFSLFGPQCNVCNYVPTNQKVVFVYTLLAESSVEPGYFSLSLGARKSESSKTE